MAFPVVLAVKGAKRVFSFFKNRKKSNSTEDALKILANKDIPEEEKLRATTLALADSLKSEGFLTRNWRPTLMVSGMAMIGAYMLGYTPADLPLDTMPPVLDRMFDLVKTGLMVGIPARTAEKVVKEFSLGSLIKNFVAKKLL